MPDGGKREAITGGQMRVLGVKPGVPDLLMPVVSGPECGLALELKRPTGHMGPEQNDWADRLMGTTGSLQCGHLAFEVIHDGRSRPWRCTPARPHDAIRAAFTAWPLLSQATP